MERKIEVDRDGDEYYAYSITDQGVEELLRLDEDMPAGAVTDASVGAAGFADDEIPFRAGAATPAKELKLCNPIGGISPLSTR